MMKPFGYLSRVTILTPLTRRLKDGIILAGDRVDESGYNTNSVN